MTILPVTTLGALPDTPAQRLSTAAAQQAGDAFATALDEAARSTPVPGKGPQSGTLPELRQFESFVLRSFVETMLPKDNSSFFGSGTAGGIWRSMMAERLGDEIAAAGGIGIADLLAESRDVAAAGDRLRAAHDAERSTDASALNSR